MIPRDGIETGECSHHEDIAVSKIDQLHDAIDQRIAQGDQGKDEPQLQAIQHLLYKVDRVVANQQHQPVQKPPHAAGYNAPYECL